MLESLDRTNIRNLNLDEPGLNTEPSFYAERDLLESDWEQALGSLERYKEHGSWARYTRLTAAMTLAFPDRKDQLEVNQMTKETILTSLTRTFLGLHGSQNWLFRSAAVLFPRETRGLMKEAEGTEGGNMSLRTIFSNLSMLESFGFVEAVEELTDAYVTLPADYNDHIKSRYFQNWIDKFLPKAISTSKDNWIYNYSVDRGVKSLANLRILYPELWPFYRVNSKMWSNALNNLDELRANKLSSRDYLLMEYAEALRIICADEVRVDENGLTITDKPLMFAKPTPALPETRKF